VFDTPVTIDDKRLCAYKPCTIGRELFNSAQVGGVVTITPRELLLSDNGRYTYSWLATRGFVPQLINNTTLTDVVLQSADLSRAIIEYCVFTRIRADWMRFKGTEVNHCTFSNVNFAHSYWRQCDMGANTFLECNLRDSTLTSINAHDVRFVKCDLTATDMSYAVLNDCTFINCTGTLARRFVRAYFAFCTFTNCDLRGANFSYADLSTTEFINCKLDGAIFTGALLSSATLINSDSSRIISE